MILLTVEHEQQLRVLAIQVKDIENVSVTEKGVVIQHASALGLATTSTVTDSIEVAQMKLHIAKHGTIPTEVIQDSMAPFSRYGTI